MCRIILQKQVREGSNEVTNVRVLKQCRDAVGDKPCANAITVDEGRERMIKDTKPAASSSRGPKPIVHQALTSERYYKPEVRVSLSNGRPRFSLQRSSTSTQESRSISLSRAAKDIPPRAPTQPPFTGRLQSLDRDHAIHVPSAPYLLTTRTPSSTRSSSTAFTSMPPPLRPLTRQTTAPQSDAKPPTAPETVQKRGNLSIVTGPPPPRTSSGPRTSDLPPSPYSPGFRAYHDSAYYSSVSSAPSSSDLPSPTRTVDNTSVPPGHRRRQKQRQTTVYDEDDSADTATTTTVNAEVTRGLWREEARRVDRERLAALDRLEGRSASRSSGNGDGGFVSRGILNERSNYYYDNSSNGGAYDHGDRDQDRDYDRQNSRSSSPDTGPPSLSGVAQSTVTVTRTGGVERRLALGDADETARRTADRIREAEDRMARDEESVRSSAGGSMAGSGRRRRKTRGETRSENGDGRGLGRLRRWFRS